MEDDLCFQGIGTLAGRIRDRALSPVRLTEAYLERIQAIDPQLCSYITVTADHAMAQAGRAEAELAQGRWRGPLHGIPFGLKDMYDTRGIRTTAHSRVLQHNVPAADAAVVERLYDAGAVLLGKHATHEFAHGGPSFDLPWPPARNPWNPAHYTGSSSTGSGAAVAGGLATFALGTDTGGSVRSPAWLCGVVGFKPTFGLASRIGVVPFSTSCDVVGPLARRVEDAAIVTEAIAGYDPRDPGSARSAPLGLRAALGWELDGLRIGVLRHHWEEDTRVNPQLARAVDDALDLLRALGAQVEDVRVRPLHEYYGIRLALTESELYARHQDHLRTHASDYGHHFLGRALAATLFTASDYIAAQRERRNVIAEFQSLYARYDAFITSGAGPAPHMDSHRHIGASQKWATPSMGTLFSLTGGPALAIPCGFSDQGLPLGMQIAGRPFDDARVLAIGHAYEQAARWFERRPRLQPHAAAPQIDTRADAVEIPQPDAALRAQVESAVRTAGLQLSDEQFELLYESAPYALALMAKIRRDLPWSNEPAAAFNLTA
jgi:aspartyl-tRNA(Asn)/glutamyl-tRNA(Gln) amidotransferase subunit A